MSTLSPSGSGGGGGGEVEQPATAIPARKINGINILINLSSLITYIHVVKKAEPLLALH
ncbi:hypothetical protein [Anaerobiospirillum sp. NML120511]|uniref:hypothetical protein n=1 Tax=Anaerobiospirillum sp. NML120511 TaxID=2932819 RepID=UPI001FF3086D|nr:hypothetical protein [Anaerobiospirillum sp. NML120511]MCK0535739.1 hypothetical protein [Anaerobiospirillum sp. NML120511]